jgi:lysozyme
MASTDDDLDLETIILWLAGAAVLYQIVRYAQSTPGFNFSAAAPGTAGSGGIPLIGPALSSAIARTVSPSGRAFIQSNEGFSLKPYPDAGGQAIYWGHRIQPGETFNNTRAQADQVFDKDIAIAESAINRNVRVALSQDQFDALADIAYNRGAGNFAKSAVVKALNAGNYASAAQAIKGSPGAPDRRAADAQRFSGAG